MATKYDGGKTRMHLIPADIMRKLQNSERVMAPLCVGRVMTDEFSVAAAMDAWADWWERKDADLDALTWAMVTLLRALDDEHELGGWGVLGEVFTIGALKYTDHNWRTGKGFVYSRLWSATKRHEAKHDVLTAEGLPPLDAGEGPHAPGTGLPHKWHALWGYFVLYCYLVWGMGIDDRPDPEEFRHVQD